MKFGTNFDNEINVHYIRATVGGISSYKRGNKMNSYVMFEKFSVYSNST